MGKRIVLRTTMLLGITILNPPHPGVVGVPYTHTFLAFGGNPPYTWELINTLPIGWSFNASTATLSNPAPATAMVFPITLFVRDVTWDHDITVTFLVTVVNYDSDLTGTLLGTEDDIIFAYEDGAIQIPE